MNNTTQRLQDLEQRVRAPAEAAIEAMHHRLAISFTGSCCDSRPM